MLNGSRHPCAARSLGSGFFKFWHDGTRRVLAVEKRRNTEIFPSGPALGTNRTGLLAFLGWERFGEAAPSQLWLLVTAAPPAMDTCAGCPTGRAADDGGFFWRTGRVGCGGMRFDALDEC